MTDQQSTKVFLGGLWLNKTKAGDTYMSGKIGVGGKLLIFKNSNKQKDSDPDYMLYIVPVERKPDETAPLQDSEDVPF